VFIKLLATDEQRKSTPTKSMIAVNRITAITDWIVNGESVGCVLVIDGIPGVNHFVDLYEDVQSVLRESIEII
jgi:hypothetical protein